ncbi:MBL fold metallo-hydrolase [Methanosphaerula subterraneus]|uniref:MBL fold metallo-hydrolase n=1 Tax=Methanosphaerula subterraneus TaxID=3350244 RepID=UPI003F83F1A8
MILEKFVAEGLAHYSYLIGSGQQAAVIDPRRDCEVYIAAAEAHEQTITDIFETHRNEDYVIGSVELAARTGATIHHGEDLDFRYGVPAKDGEVVSIGSLSLAVRKTPGHTPESISIVVTDRAVSDRPYLVFTGDLLFAGSVGRVDLTGNTAGAAALMHRSLHEALLPLGDGVIVCPAHGAGSVCGGHISDHPLTTLGYEKGTNPFLALDNDAFVARRVQERTYIPPYFSMMERLNRDGPPLLPASRSPAPLTPAAVKAFQERGARVLDIRSPTGFGAGHIPGSLNIWREGIAAYAGWMLNYTDPIVLVDDFNLDLDRVVRTFQRLGYDNVAGYLAGGFSAWSGSGNPIAAIETWSPQDLAGRLADPDLLILDVRDINNRTEAGWIEGSQHSYIGQLPAHLDTLPRDRLIVIHCDVGYKGSLGASILVARGFSRVVNLLGGFGGWMKAGLPVKR